MVPIGEWFERVFVRLRMVELPEDDRGRTFEVSSRQGLLPVVIGFPLITLVFGVILLTQWLTTDNGIAGWVAILLTCLLCTLLCVPIVIGLGWSAWQVRFEESAIVVNRRLGRGRFGEDNRIEFTDRGEFIVDSVEYERSTNVDDFKTTRKVLMHFVVYKAGRSEQTLFSNLYRRDAERVRRFIVETLASSDESSSGRRQDRQFMGERSAGRGRRRRPA